MAIQIKRVSITSARFKTLQTTPLELLAAPAAGTVNVLFSLSIRQTYIAPVYTAINYLMAYLTNPNIFYLAIWQTIWGQSQNLVEQGTMLSTVDGAAQPSTLLWPVALDDALMLTADTNPATGNSTFKVTIIYENKVVTDV